MVLKEGVVFQGEETAQAEAIGGKDPMHFGNRSLGRNVANMQGKLGLF